MSFRIYGPQATHDTPLNEMEAEEAIELIKEAERSLNELVNSLPDDDPRKAIARAHFEAAFAALLRAVDEVMRA